jgi:hypothetical protein
VIREYIIEGMRNASARKKRKEKEGRTHQMVNWVKVLSAQVQTTLFGWAATAKQTLQSVNLA